MATINVILFTFYDSSNFFSFFLNNKPKLEKMIAALVTVNNNVNATSIQTKKNVYEFYIQTTTKSNRSV